MIRIRQILCPVDFSPFARRALDHAAVLARWYEAELTVLHVSPLLPTLFGMEPAVNAASLAPFDREALGRELLQFVGETPLGTGMTGFSIGTAFQSYHFQVDSTGNGPDGAVSNHTQSFYVIGPGT